MTGKPVIRIAWYRAQTGDPSPRHTGKQYVIYYVLSSPIIIIIIIGPNGHGPRPHHEGPRLVLGVSSGSVLYCCALFGTNKKTRLCPFWGNLFTMPIGRQSPKMGRWIQFALTADMVVAEILLYRFYLLQAGAHIHGFQLSCLFRTAVMGNITFIFVLITTCFFYVVSLKTNSTNQVSVQK